MKRKGISLHGSLFAFLVVTSMLLQSACSTKNHDNLDPVIHGVRYVSPDSGATDQVKPGQTIVIQGENLATTQKVTFDGYNAPINQTLYTDSTVIATIPADLPFGVVKQDSVNKIYLVTKFGSTSFTFPILPPQPVITGISNEFAHAGETITITGQYLYLIQGITFPGGVKADKYSSIPSGTMLQVTVPAGVTSGGAIAVETVSGIGTSTPAASFNDQTGMVCNFDDVNPYSWGAAAVTNDASQFPEGWGNYAHLTASGVAGGDYAWWGGTRCIYLNNVPLIDPSHINDPIDDYALKFEINVKAPWTTGALFIVTADSWNYSARYAPYENTGGSFQTNGWQTVTIPLNMFKAKVNGVNAAGDPAPSLSVLLGYSTDKATQKNINIAYMNDGTTVQADLDLAIDNIRIVKIAD